ncbi:MAG: DsrE family protein [Gammaproteobacteria bacterium]|nr:DsrE family protein [Gammaproteobacteria bacterium]
MKLGILITTDRHLDQIIHISNAASAKGHELSLFAMNEGTRLLAFPEFAELCKLDNIIMSLCHHSATELGVDTSDISKEIVIGSQFNNAMMNNQSDKVIVL